MADPQKENSHIDSVGSPLTMKRSKKKPTKLKLKSFFKIGVSKDYILIRDDFPICSVPPGEFSKLCTEMFRKNDEVLNGK